MNVLLISQCDKRALTETRRILDQFAERRGDRTWQTPITQDGLDTLRKLLRKTARKNTAVACHWIRGLDHSELLWTVGDASRFNEQGAVPTNTTRRNVLREQDQNDWHTAQDIRLLAQLAALLHDLGKATVAFQERLSGKRREVNLIRHEWASLRMFQAFVGEDNDAQWLTRLASQDAADAQAWLSPDRLCRDGQDSLDLERKRPFAKLPPLAAAVAWLVVSHHRLPSPERDAAFRPAWLETPLAQIDHRWNEPQYKAEQADDFKPYWDVSGTFCTASPEWCKEVAKLAQRLLALQAQRTEPWLDNPYVMHLARLSLMLADHHFSSLPPTPEQIKRRPVQSELFANTDAQGRLKQTLTEHLVGVAKDASLIARALPYFASDLPALSRRKSLQKRSGAGRFAWQDKAVDAACAMRESAAEHGAFIVNMASTGCGKTLANARLLNALADPQRGLRAAYALGLRSLTLQTGRSYRHDLQLRDEDLAILVGGSASRALFKFYEAQQEATGSASAQKLIEEDVQVIFEGDMRHHPLLSRALGDPDIQRLLLAPMLVCTVDHLAPATEGTRAGRQIAPMLRLLSGDLVLDELDDYELADLPALTRLVHWAGMLGTRVIVSSATLPPALIEGMFAAYRAGRLQHQRNRGGGGLKSAEQAAMALHIPCLWVDEFGCHQASCSQAAEHRAQHAHFVDQRVRQLGAAPALRQACLQPLQLSSRNKAEIAREFAQPLREACLKLHHQHAEQDPVTGKKVSFGLLRMANVDAIFHCAHALFEMGAPDDIRIHLCVYHARFPLVQRSAIERQLDTVFNRRGPQEEVFHLPSVRAALDTNSEHHQVFMVLASPVCEVGRDWDASWAVAEPSSLRSIIQLAGRVQRHRAKAPATPNILIFDTNLKYFRQTGVPDRERKAIFLRPGFEADVPLMDSHGKPRPFRLHKSRLDALLRPNEWSVVSALPRIQAVSPLDRRPHLKLVDLEHARMEDTMLPKNTPVQSADRLCAATAWQFPATALTGYLPHLQMFRRQTQKMETLVFRPNDEGELTMCRMDPAQSRSAPALYPFQPHLLHTVQLNLGDRISPWGEHDLLELVKEQTQAHDMDLDECAKKFTVVEVGQSKDGIGWLHHPLLGFQLAG